VGACLDGVAVRDLKQAATLATLSGALGASTAWAHPIASPGFDTGTLPWSWEPWVLGCLGASGLLYALGLARLRRRAGPNRGLRSRQIGAFAAGWIALVVALVSPLDPLGSRLFSAHMLQHEVLMVVAAPLLVLGRPLAAWSWAFPRTITVAIGSGFRRHGWRTFWHALTRPLSAWSLHAIALWGWHLPGAFEAALVRPGVHAAQHFCFLATALLFWWTTIGAVSRQAQGYALASLFTTMAHTAALGALMSLSPLLWYPSYTLPSAALGIDPLEDQQLGGLLMWIPAGAAYLAAALWIASGWLRGTPGLVDGERTTSVHGLPPGVTPSRPDHP
jgi:putative membrane protein